jgi:hypothetical protein
VRERLDAGCVAPRGSRALEYLIHRLNSALSLQHAQKIHRAEFDDPIPIADDYAPQDRAFLAQ